MGLFSSILTVVGKVAKAASPLLAGTAIGSALGIAADSILDGSAPDTAVTSALSPAGQLAVAQAGGPTALIGTGPGSQAPASALFAATPAQQATVVGLQGGQANVFTRTIVQRISRANGTVLSSRALVGSPFLMNAEVRALRRVSKMIQKAAGKIPKRSASISEDRLNKAVTERVMQLSATQHLITPHNGKTC